MTPPAPEPLLYRPPFRIDYLPGQGGDLMLAFASIGHDPLRMPSPEFIATAGGGGARHALLIMDESRSWANDPGFAPALREAVALVQARAELRQMAAMGLSMGGFSALAAARVLPLDAVLAFGPQYSILPAHMPGERRWQHWTAALEGRVLAGEALEGQALAWPVAPLPERAWTCIFHGLADDQAQAAAFPLRPNLDHLLFEGLTHSELVPHLKQRGVLAGLVSALFAGDRRRLLRIATSAGGRRRRSAA